MIFSMERQALTVSSPNPTKPRRCVRILVFLEPAKAGCGTAGVRSCSPLIGHVFVNHGAIIEVWQRIPSKSGRQAGEKTG